MFGAVAFPWGKLEEWTNFRAILGKPFPIEGGWKRFSMENDFFFPWKWFSAAPPKCVQNVSNFNRQKSFLCTFFDIICSLIEEYPLWCDSGIKSNSCNVSLPSFLAQPHGSQNNAFLGSCCKLGICCSCTFYFFFSLMNVCISWLCRVNGTLRVGAEHFMWRMKMICEGGSFFIVSCWHLMRFLSFKVNLLSAVLQRGNLDLGASSPFSHFSAVLQKMQIIMEMYHCRKQWKLKLLQSWLSNEDKISLEINASKLLGTNIPLFVYLVLNSKDF